MLTRRSDETTRIVSFLAQGEDKIEGYSPRQKASRPIRLSPVNVTCEFADGVLERVVVNGPIVTSTGRLHSTMWISWQWPSHRVEHRVPLPEANPPQIVLDALKDLGYGPDGQPL